DFADKRSRDILERAEKERAERAEKERAERAEKERAERAEKERAAKELAKQYAAECDVLAANPNDQPCGEPQRPAPTQQGWCHVRPVEDANPSSNPRVRVGCPTESS